MAGRAVVPTRAIARLAIVALLASAAVVIPAQAQAAGKCGTSNGHTLCVTVPASPLQGEATVTVTNAANNGVVIATWLPSGGPTTTLIYMYAPSPSTNDYSFVWPTQKYLDASGTLRLQAGSTGSTPVEVSVTLGNGNSTDFQHNPNDWTSLLPGPWSAPTDPTILAVGDGPSNEVASNGVAARIAALDPPLFLNLGDIYDTGTFTEYRNAYGVSEIDHPGQGTLWGATADVTQPTLGNHEKVNIPAYTDYWHGRPLYTSFTFGGVLFVDLNSSQNMTSTKPMYQYAKSVITDPSAPACIVAFFHEPAVTSNTTVASNEVEMWKLLANNGVDLVLNGHQHNMIEYKPLDADFNAGTANAHMVQLVNGAGGHAIAGVTKVPPGARIAWSKGKTPGLLALRLKGAADGNAATSIGWQWQDLSGNVLRSNSVDCGSGGNRAPVVDAGPDQQITLPGDATMQGSVTDDGLPNPPGAVTTTWSQVSGPGIASFADASSPTTTVGFSAPGTYVLRLRADDGAAVSTDDVTVDAIAAGTVTLNIPVSQSPDDAEESETGTVGRASTQLELVDKGTDRQTVGVRFIGVTVPAGATIQNAYIQFEVASITTASASLTIEGQAADDPSTFTTANFDISSRPRTTAAVSWTPAPWSTLGAHGPDQRGDVTPVVQELVNRAGWGSGNAMAFIVTGSGTRTAQSFNGTFAPVLHIEYTT